MIQHIGKYLRSKFRGKGITDLSIAKHLGLTKSAVEKIYPENDIYVSRLIKLSELAKEDLFDFYYEKEPLKSLRKSLIERLNQELEDVKIKLQYKEDQVKNLEQMNKIQKELIDSLSSKKSIPLVDKVNSADKRNKKTKTTKRK